MFIFKLTNTKMNHTLQHISEFIERTGISYAELITRFDKQLRREGFTIEESDYGLTLAEYFYDRDTNLVGFFTVALIDKEATTEDFTALAEVVIAKPGDYVYSCLECMGEMEHFETLSHIHGVKRVRIKCKNCGDTEIIQYNED